MTGRKMKWKTESKKKKTLETGIIIAVSWPILSFCQIRSAFGAAEQDDSANFPANEVASGVGIVFGGWPIPPILVRPGTRLVRLWYTLKPQKRSMVPGFGTPGTPCRGGVGGWPRRMSLGSALPFASKPHQGTAAEAIG